MSKTGVTRRKTASDIDIPIPWIVFFGAVAYVAAVVGWLLAKAGSGLDAGDVVEAFYLALSVVAPSDAYTVSELRDAGVQPGSSGWITLLIARWFGVVFFALSVAKVVLTWLYQGVVKQLGRRRFRDHVVVVGKTPFADSVAAAAADEGAQVVQFEPDGKETVPDGILTMDSNLPLADMLKWSAAHRARALVFATGDNAECADLAERVYLDKDFRAEARAANGAGKTQGRSKRLEPHIFVAADDAWYERRDELNYRFHQPHKHPVERSELDCVVEFVSESRAAARAVMTSEPVYRLQTGEIQHILIVGFGAMGRAILTEFCETQRTDPDRLPWVTIVDPDPDVWESFTQRVPEWEKAFNGAVFHTTIATLGDERGRFAWRLKTAPPAAIYVATGAGLDSMAAAADVKHVLADLSDRGALDDERVRCPIFACARGGSERLDGGAARLVSREAGASVKDRFPIVQFGSWPDVVDASRVLHDYPDAAAWQVHETHRENFRGDPANWSQAQEFERYSSRSAAAFVPALLHAAGFDLACWLAHTDDHRPSADRLPRLAPGLGLAEDPSTLVRLARLEHARWCAERIFRGFQAGPRDDARKRHPDLVAFDALPETSKVYNIRYIAGLQAMLLKHGDGPQVARAVDARRPVMRPTDVALVRDAGIDPASLTPQPAEPAKQDDPMPDPDTTELAHG